MHNHYIKRILSLALCVLALVNTLEAKKYQVHISIPIEANNLPVLNNILLNLQSKIQKAARQNGYYFDTEEANKHGFHITLETVSNVDEKDLRRCRQCVQTSINKLKKEINLTGDLAKAHFEIMGRSGALAFPAPKLLADLRKDIRDCLKTAKFKVGKYEVFKPHISLGKFFAGDHTALPSNNDLEWVPHIKIKLPKKYFIVASIITSKREMPDNKKEKQQSLTAAAAYPPAQQPPAALQQKKVKEKKVVPTEKEESSGFSCAVQ